MKNLGASVTTFVSLYFPRPSDQESPTCNSFLELLLRSERADSALGASKLIGCSKESTIFTSRIIQCSRTCDPNGIADLVDKLMSFLLRVREHYVAINIVLILASKISTLTDRRRLRELLFENN